MTDQTTENFWKVWSEFKWPDPYVPSYRLYYHDDGSPKCYSMEPLPGKYIDIDSATYALRPWNVRVINDRLEFVQPTVVVKKLQPNQIQGTCCHTQDVCVVVADSQTHSKWNTVTHEIR
jgi:hypothetical protein